MRYVHLFWLVLWAGCDTDPPGADDAAVDARILDATPGDAAVVDAEREIPCDVDRDCPPGFCCDESGPPVCRRDACGPPECAEGEIYDPETQQCVTPPCVDDAECPEGRCTDAGQCVDSACSSVRPCALDRDGRTQQCSAAGECEPLYPCCTVDGECLLTLDGACPGAQLEAALQGGNDNPQQAVNLGPRDVAICDTWLCREGDEDYFEIVVPAGEDRTVFVEYRNQEDGRVFIDVEGPERDPIDVNFGGFRRSSEPQGNHQCINLRGGAQAQRVIVRIFANHVLEDGDDRLDYSLLVAPTDMAGLDPADPASLIEHQGECVTLGADDLGTCPSDNPFADGCWPFMALE